MPHKVIEETQ